jgi:cell surface protein SprA
LNYKANFSYIYNNRPNNITPLRSVKALRNPYLRLLRDLNFNLAPSKVSFRTDLNREYLETGIRNLITNDTMFTYFNDYTWNRYFDFKWDISKALTFDFSSKNISRFDEQRKSAEDFGFLGLTNIEQDPDFENYTGMLGARTLNYQHNIHLGWKVPINKIPALDFINMTADYTGNYNWMSGPKNLELENDTIGNTISNNQTVSLRTSLRLTKLYFKVPLLKNIDRKYSGRGRKKQEKETEIITYVREDVYLREGASKSINHKLKTEDITVKVTDKEGNPADPEVRIVNENKIRITVKRDMPDGRVVVEGEVEKRENPVIFLAEQTVRILMGLKDINVNYQLSNGMVIPDFKGNADIFGIDQNIQFSDYTFFAGNVNEDFLDELHEKGALYRNNLVSPVTMNRSEKLDAKATYEPFKGFKIRLTAFKNRSMSEERIYNYDIFPNDPFRNKTEMGNYSISYITLGSAFQKITGEDNYQSDVFDQFNEYRPVVSDMLATELEEKNNSYSRSQDPETIERGYNYGYNSTSREVLLPAFLSAYGYKDINEVTLHNMFPEIPMPNWQVNFDGLSNIEFIEEYFRSINIMHSYRSRYNVSSYATNLSYEEDAYGLPMLDLQNNFMTPYDASSISIDESFSPVVGVEMNWHNSLITSFEWKKSRNLRLNFVNNQLMEDLTNELVFGAGYNIKDFELAINAGNGLKVFTSDLVLRADVTLSDLKTIIRVLTPKSGKDIEYNTINGGDKRHSIKFSADYAMSDSFTVRFFFERQGSEPALSTSHPYANTQIGFSIRFTLVN